MKRVNLITLVSATLLLGGTFGYVSFGPMLDAKETWALAADVFEGGAEHKGIPSSEFVPPNKPDVSHGLQYVVLSWAHRSRVGCSVDVTVDRRYANAMSHWLCD